MNSRLSLLSGLGLTFAFSCASQHPTRDDRVTTVGAPPRSVQCEMAFTALNASIRSPADEPLALERACVQRVAGLDGKIYVDARFAHGHDLEEPDVPTCQRGNYVIRLDWRSFTPSPTSQVVLLSVGDGSGESREFDVTTDASNWPAKSPGTVGLSPCYSTFGLLHRSGSGWQAELKQAPKSPDAL